MSAGNLQLLAGQPLARLNMFVVVSRPLFHWAHHFRFVAAGWGLKGMGESWRSSVTRSLSGVPSARPSPWRLSGLSDGKFYCAIDSLLVLKNNESSIPA